MFLRCFERLFVVCVWVLMFLAVFSCAFDILFDVFVLFHLISDSLWHNLVLIIIKLVSFKSRKINQSISRFRLLCEKVVAASARFPGLAGSCQFGVLKSFPEILLRRKLYRVHAIAQNPLF